MVPTWNLTSGSPNSTWDLSFRYSPLTSSFPFPLRFLFSPLSLCFSSLLHYIIHPFVYVDLSLYLLLLQDVYHYMTRWYNVSTVEQTQQSDNIQTYLDPSPHSFLPSLLFLLARSATECRYQDRTHPAK